MSAIFRKTLDCGLRLLIEPMAGAESAALSWALPVGAAGDASGRVGESAVLNEFIPRGAGGMTSREHSDALDRLGVQRSSTVGTHHLSISTTMLGSNLLEALPLITILATDLTLPEEGLEPSKSLCLQTIESLRDDPQHATMLLLSEKHLPPPFNRHGYGVAKEIEALTIEQVREAWRKRCVPSGSILGIAGAVDPNAAAKRLNELLHAWQGHNPEPDETDAPARGVTSRHEPTAQVHIGVGYDAPREADAEAMLERLAVSVLSGGMSGRLFTEVRERRSLCYSVNASYSAGRDFGMVSLYAGTTPERAQETLDVCVHEVNRLRDGVSDAEFQRAVVGLKSRLVMQGESTSARSWAIVRDEFRLGHPRTLEEIAAAVDDITLDQLNDYLAGRDFGHLTVACVGPVALTLHEE